MAVSTDAAIALLASQEQAAALSDVDVRINQIRRVIAYWLASIAEMESREQVPPALALAALKKAWHEVDHLERQKAERPLDGSACTAGESGNAVEVSPVRMVEMLDWFDAFARRLIELGSDVSVESADRVAIRAWHFRLADHRPEHPTSAAERWYVQATSTPGVAYSAALACEQFDDSYYAK